MSKDLNYENNNIGKNEQYSEEGIKCKNYILCNTILPKEHSYVHNYLCMNCEIYNFKELIFSNEECPICMEIKKCIKQPQCSHFICVDCFKEIYIGNEPKFPYSDIENEYDDDPNNEKWKKYPLIDKYNKDFINWDDNRISKFENTKYFKKCPLCRENIEKE